MKASAGPAIDRALLLLIAALSAILWVATPSLIVPWPQDVAWHESAAFFPRLGLALAVAGGLLEWWRRGRHDPHTGAGAEELDATTVRPREAAAAIACFAAYAALVGVLGYAVSTALFLLVCGRLVHLSWKVSATVALGLTALLWLGFVAGLRLSFGHGLLF